MMQNQDAALNVEYQSVERHENMIKHQEIQKESSIYEKKWRKNHGIWSLQEQQKFLKFIVLHREIFEKKALRREQRIYKKMQAYIRTRSSELCRSHFQKYELKLKKVQNIIDELQTRIAQIQNDPKLQNFKSSKKETKFDHTSVDTSKKKSMHKHSSNLSQKSNLQKSNNETFNSLKRTHLSLSSKIVAQSIRQWVLYKEQPNSFKVILGSDFLM